MGPWNGCAKYDISVLASACYKGDLDMLETLLGDKTSSKEDRFVGDINTHVTELTPLMYAARNGQIEAVEMMLKAKADPHMKCRVPYGKDSSEGETAQDIAARMGYDDIVKMLKKAESEVAPHKYKRYGKNNNARLEIYQTGESGRFKNPFDGFKLRNYAAAGPRTAKRPTSIGLIFPGQGSQYVKMMTANMDSPKTKELISIAEEVMGFKIKDIMQTGPEQELEETRVAQAAMFLAGMAGLEILRQQRPEAVERPLAVAGYSSGEITALCAAGVFTFREGMEIVKVRGEAMAEASQAPPQAMISVAGLHQETLEKLCAEQAKNGEVCQIAALLFPKGFSCSGTVPAIMALKDAADAAGAMQAKVTRQDGAWHTPLMEPARLKLEAKLNKMLPNMQPPTCNVYLNHRGTMFKAGTDPSAIVPYITKQLVNVVYWEHSVRQMIGDGVTEFFEVGPMKQLKAMMKRVDVNMWNNTTNVEV